MALEMPFPSQFVKFDVSLRLAAPVKRAAELRGATCVGDPIDLQGAWASDDYSKPIHTSQLSHPQSGHKLKPGSAGPLQPGPWRERLNGWCRSEKYVATHGIESVFSAYGRIGMSCRSELSPFYTILPSARVGTNG